jgi:hypothetical protein
MFVFRLREMSTNESLFLFASAMKKSNSYAITIKVVSSNSDHGEEYSIQHYVKKFVKSEVFPRYFGFQ